MTEPESHALRQFLGAARRRLWAEAVLDSGIPGLWGAALVLAAAGAWAAAIGHVPPAASGALALLVVAGALGYAAVFRVPGPMDAAAEADRRLASGDLLVTACELDRTPDRRRSGAAGIVLARAAALAGATRRLPGPADRRPLAPRLVLPLALASLGVVMYVAAPAPVTVSSSDPAATSLAAPIRGAVDSLRPSPRNSADPGTSSGARLAGTRAGLAGTPRPPTASGAPRTPKPAPANAGAPVPNAPPIAAGAATATATGPNSTPGGRDTAGSEPASDARPTGGSPAAAAAVRTFGISRPGAGRRGLAGGGSFSAPDPVAARPPVSAGLPAVATSLSVRGPAWTPQLRAYAARYLAARQGRR